MHATTWKSLDNIIVIIIIIIIKDFIYLFMRDTDTQREAETQAEGEAGREPDVGLDPGSPGSGPGLKAELNR